MFLTRQWRTLREFWRMPRVSINLMCDATTGNDPFYSRVVRESYRQAMSRHPRWFLLRRMVHGVALCQLPPTFDQYYMRIEGSARRNHKKASREGCVVQPITFNDHLEAIGEIRASADVRQGRPMPEAYRNGVVTPTNNPVSNSPLHGYPYFGVFAKDSLIGYAGCLIAGEFCGIEQIFGHADHLTLGAVPQLLIGIARHLYEQHPQVKFYAYGTYFGASESMRRFKRKFDFCPHHVSWQLGDQPSLARTQLTE